MLMKLGGPLRYADLGPGRAATNLVTRAHAGAAYGRRPSDPLATPVAPPTPKRIGTGLPRVALNLGPRR